MKVWEYGSMKVLRDQRPTIMASEYIYAAEGKTPISGFP